MSDNLSFGAAYARWQASLNREPLALEDPVHEPFDEAEHHRVEEAERVLLDHAPTSLEEAALMLEVLALEVANGERSDGRDIQALQRLAGSIVSLGRTVTQRVA